MITHHWAPGSTAPCGMQVSMVNGHAFVSDWDKVTCPDCLKPALHNYYVTFGVKYRHEKHEHWSGAHPDGWLEVIAPDYDSAWALANRYVGRAFAFMYEEDRFQRSWHPLGRLAYISSSGVEWTREGVEPPTPITERTVTVSWYETTHYTADIDVDEDFDLGADDADERLEELICDLPSEQMDKAFTGTTDRQITDKEWA